MNRVDISRYADVVRMWGARYNTAEIAEHTGLHESTVARWIANFREVTREGRVDLAIQAGAYDA